MQLFQTKNKKDWACFFQLSKIKQLCPLQENAEQAGFFAQ